MPNKPVSNEVVFRFKSFERLLKFFRANSLDLSRYHLKNPDSELTKYIIHISPVLDSHSIMLIAAIILLSQVLQQMFLPFGYRLPLVCFVWNLKRNAVTSTADKH